MSAAFQDSGLSRRQAFPALLCQLTHKPLVWQSRLLVATRADDGERSLYVGQ